MAIVANDILFKFSVVAAAGNTTASSGPTSLGDQISTVALVSATLHDLFDKVTGPENAASEAEYRCFFVHNAHATLTWENVVVWLSAEVGAGAVAAIALDDFAPMAIGQASPQADAIADENTAPGAGVGAFSSPTTKGTGLSIGNIPAGFCKAIWVRRTAANTAALNNDGVTLTFEGDTAA
jgi:hypothetical protein